MKVLITGGAGWLGTAVASIVGQYHLVRVFDQKPAPAAPAGRDVESVVGSMADRKSVEAAVADQDAVIHAAIADWRHDAYEVGNSCPFDVNVWGTYNLLDAARLAGVRRIILISAAETHVDHPPGTWIDRNTPYIGVPRIYDLTKRLQEEMARWFVASYGLDIVALRLGSVVDVKLGRNRHGGTTRWNKTMDSQSWVDRFDVGRACVCALEAEHRGWDVFHLIGAPGAKRMFDVARAEACLDIQFTVEFDRRAESAREGRSPTV